MYFGNCGDIYGYVVWLFGIDVWIVMVLDLIVIDLICFVGCFDVVLDIWVFDIGGVGMY